MTVPITALSALPLSPIFMALFFCVSSRRTDLKASIGHADDAALHERIRPHGNFVEWVPFVLILMLLAERMGAPALYLHSSGALLLIGRMGAADHAAHPMRYVGDGTNILGTLNAMACFGVNILALKKTTPTPP